jgi:hypothetical protein
MVKKAVGRILEGAGVFPAHNVDALERDNARLREEVRELEIRLAGSRGRVRDLERKLSATNAARLAKEVDPEPVMFVVSDNHGVITALDLRDIFEHRIEPNSFVFHRLTSRTREIVEKYDREDRTPELCRKIEREIRSTFERYAETGFAACLGQANIPEEKWTPDTKAFVVHNIQGTMQCVKLVERKHAQDGTVVWRVHGLDGRSYGDMKPGSLYVVDRYQ